MAERGAAVALDELLITSGSQQGFDFLVRALVEPGSLVLVEEPTYSATLQALRLAGADVRGVPSDHDGMNVDALEAMLANAPARPRMIYTVPTFANPTGATLSPARRLQLLELVARHEIVLVEDDPYGALSFDGPPPPSLLALCDQVPGARPWLVHLASLSKTLAPGLRLGWMVAAPEIVRRAVIAKQVSDLCTPPWLQLTAAHYLQAGNLPGQIAREVAVYRDKRDRLTTALRQAFGTRIRFADPAGGMFLWVSVDGIDDAAALLPHAIAEKVLFVPGAGFYAERRARPRSGCRSWAPIRRRSKKAWRGLPGPRRVPGYPSSIRLSQALRHPACRRSRTRPASSHRTGGCLRDAGAPAAPPPLRRWRPQSPLPADRLVR
jgi:DNA-binding transcriptional MocR family regulator